MVSVALALGRTVVRVETVSGHRALVETASGPRVHAETVHAETVHAAAVRAGMASGPRVHTGTVLAGTVLGETAIVGRRRAVRRIVDRKPSSGC